MLNLATNSPYLFLLQCREQADPVYEAKGIETVRRDGCPAVAKILEKCLRILFDTRDVSRVKQFAQRQGRSV